MHAPLRVPSVIFFTNTHLITDAWGRTLTTSNARAKPPDKRKEGAPHVSNLASRPCRQPVVLLEWLTSRSVTLPCPCGDDLLYPLARWSRLSWGVSKPTTVANRYPKCETALAPCDRYAPVRSSVLR